MVRKSSLAKRMKSVEKKGKRVSLSTLRGWISWQQTIEAELIRLGGKVPQQPRPLPKPETVVVADNTGITGLLSGVVQPEPGESTNKVRELAELGPHLKLLGRLLRQSPTAQRMVLSGMKGEE